MSRNNTGNPIDSKAFADFEDNVKNLDLAANSSADAFQDRLGKSRLTWAGIVKAGSGDPAIAVDAASRAVGAAGQAENEADRAAGAASRAENAEAIVDAANIKAEVDRAEAARDAAFVNADVYLTVADGRAAVDIGEQYTTIRPSGLEALRYKKVTEAHSELVASFPTSELVKVGGGELMGDVSTIKFNTVDWILEIPAGPVRFISATQNFVLPEVSVPLPTTSGYYRIEITRADKQVVFTRSNLATTNNFFAGILLVSGANVAVYGVNRYSIDDKQGLNDALPRIGRLHGEKGQIHFDFAAGILTVAAARVRVTYGYFTDLLQEQEVPIPATGWQRVVYDPASRQLSFRSVTQVLSGIEVEVGSVYTPEKLVTGIDVYSTDQYEPPIDPDEDELLIVNGTTDAGYIQPNLPGFAEVVTGNAVFGDIYSLYDALLGEFPEYVSRNLLGNDSLGNPIYKYSFKAAPVPTSGLSSEVPKIVMIAGIHGSEKAGTYCLYQGFNQICRRWQEDERLATLRWNVDFEVVPLCNPYGFDNHTRGNENGVDLERNFPTNWQAGTPGSNTYGGTAPLSELAAQYVNQVMGENQDAVYFGSFHNFSTHPNNYFIWNASATRFGVGLGRRLISRMDRVWAQRYEWMPSDQYIGYADRGAPGGGSGLHASIEHGIQGGTFEICRDFQFSPDRSMFSTYVATLGTEAFINWLLLNLEYGVQMKNSRRHGRIA